MSSHHLLAPALICAAATAVLAQPNRIQSTIDNTQTFALQGRVHPLATAANDRGAVEASFPLPFITMMLAPSAAQKAQLQQLLADQQNPASPRFHQWLTPEQYADQFGVSAGDTARIVTWLESQGFTVDPVSRSRTYLTFAGTAGQVQAAFGTSIHRYNVNGQAHFANSTDLTVPAALSPLVAGFRGLTDFHPKAKISVAKPRWTRPPDGETQYAMAPDDFATVYDITPMYSAGTNGSGGKLAVVGQSAVNAADITHFWTQFGLTSVTLTQKLVNPRQNPGYQTETEDVDESSLDLEWAGAVMRGGNIVFVYSEDVWQSAMSAVDTDAAPILSMSYGECELFDFADLLSWRQLAQQANAEGITWLAAAGDAGATDCDYSVPVTEGGLAVDDPGSFPEVTSMGGTALNGTGATYWTTGNTSTDESAKGYIPEIAWNETTLNEGYILGTGGGASAYFPQPSWQTQAGVPADGWRHVPDIAFNASSYVVPYYVYCSVCLGVTANIEYVGGTSAATPTMAGVVGLLNQYLNTNGLGNINPTIYSMFQTSPGAFHNNITGTNAMPCGYGSPGCSGGVAGYTATGSGYSSVVGFGSLDVTKFIQSWSSAAPTGPLVVASLDQNPVYEGAAENCGTSSSWNFVLTVQEEAGFATTITGITIGGNSASAQSIFGTNALGARQSLSGCVTLNGVSAPTNITFNLSGPPNSWTTSLTIPFQGPQSVLAIGGATNAASYSQTYAPGMIMSVFGTGLGLYSQVASITPLPGFMAGVQAIVCPVSCATAETAYPVYLYYVGPNQVNLQVPYEISGAADLNIVTPYNPEIGVDKFFTVSTVAPGIFVTEDGTNDLNPSTTSSPGQTTFLFITGEGKVSPTLEDGSSPPAGTPTSELPKPRAAVSMTVGGIPVSTATGSGWFVGIPPGLVGVTQINFTIPSNVPTGRQPVVVTVGTVTTQTAYINIQ